MLKCKLYFVIFDGVILRIVHCDIIILILMHADTVANPEGRGKGKQPPPPAVGCDVMPWSYYHSKLAVKIPFPDRNCPKIAKNVLSCIQFHFFLGSNPEKPISVALIGLRVYHMYQ